MPVETLLLGEPLAIELVNSLYINGHDRYDVLVEHPTVWLKALNFPALGCDELGRLRQLRDAVRALVLAQLDGHAVDEAALGLINEALGGVRPRCALAYHQGVWRSNPQPPLDAAQLYGVLAAATVELLTRHGDQLRRCAAPDCPLLFVRQHRRRRFCQPSCSGRTRQAAYLRRRRVEV